MGLRALGLDLYPLAPAWATSPLTCCVPGRAGGLGTNSASSTAPRGTGLWGTEPPDSDTAPLSSPLEPALRAAAGGQGQCCVDVSGDPGKAPGGFWCPIFPMRKPRPRRLSSLDGAGLSPRGSDSWAPAFPPSPVVTGAPSAMHPTLNPVPANLPSPPACLLLLTRARACPAVWCGCQGHPTPLWGGWEPREHGGSAHPGAAPGLTALLTKFSLQTVQFHMLEFPVTTWVDLFHLRGKQKKTKHGGGFLSQEEGSPIMGFRVCGPGTLGRSCSQRGSWQAGSEVEIA